MALGHGEQEERRNSKNFGGAVLMYGDAVVAANGPDGDGSTSCRKNLVNALVKTKNINNNYNKDDGSSFGMNSKNWLVKFTKRSY